MDEQKTPKKPLVYYSLLTMLVLTLLNALVFPTLMKEQVTQVDYGTFLTQLKNGSVVEVEIQENQIGFTATDESGKEIVYATGAMDDPDLVY